MAFTRRPFLKGLMALTAAALAAPHLLACAGDPHIQAYQLSHASYDALLQTTLDHYYKSARFNDHIFGQSYISAIIFSPDTARRLGLM